MISSGTFSISAAFAGVSLSVLLLIIALAELSDPLGSPSSASIGEPVPVEFLGDFAPRKTPVAQQRHQVGKVPSPVDLFSWLPGELHLPERAKIADGAISKLHRTRERFTHRY